MRIQAAAFAIFPARLYTRHILFYYKNQTVKSDSDWDRPQPLDQASFEELQWWYHNIWKWNGRSLLPSSSPSWALDNGRSSTIHQLEGAQSSSSSSEDISSTTELDCLNEENRQYDQPLLYIYKQGGNGSLPLLEELATEVWIWCLQNRIMIQAHQFRVSPTVLEEPMDDQATDI
ncbi:hypothetical protein PS6_011222 [Mucor atramentarius]